MAIFSTCGLIALAGAAALQDEGGQAPSLATEQHAALQREAGVWDAQVEVFVGPPGSEPQVSKGVETNEMVGELWLASRFEGAFMGSPFEGRAFLGYDTEKKMYVGTWIDSMTTQISFLQGTAEGPVRTLWTDGVHPLTGERTREKHLQTFVDDDTRSFSLSMSLGEGQWVRAMRITYRRRK